MSTSGEPAQAAEFYRAAVAANPRYALAWAGLTQSLMTLADWGVVRGAEAFPQAAQAARRLAELDSEPAIVQQAVGQIKGTSSATGGEPKRHFGRRSSAIPPM